jgi:hypothetical protein
VKELLAKKHDMADTALACFSAAGFSDDLVAAASDDPRVHLIGLDDLYR